MKIRTGFVTNSSSTSFGAAAVSGFVSGLLSALGVSSAYASSAEAAELPPAQETGWAGPDRGFDPEAFVKGDVPYEDKLAKLEREQEAYRKEWEDHKDSYEGEDYEAKKQEYDDYLDYLESAKEQAAVMEFERQVEQAHKEAQEEYRREWLERRKEDLKQAREQIEMIEATIRGYGKAGYDIEEAKSQLEQYRAKERDLDRTLQEEGVDYDYKPKPRANIGPSPVIQEKIDEINAEYEAFVEELRQGKIDRKKKAIIERNMEAWDEARRGYMDYADTADRYKKAAEATQVAADVGVDVLEKVTGPAGKSVKRAYVGLKGVAGGFGEAVADPANATSHFVKGSIKGLGDMGKEFTDSQMVKDGIGYASEMSQEMITSYQKGENPAYGAGRGFGKATIDTVVDRGTNKLFTPYGVPDASKTNVNSLISNMADKDSPLRKAIKNSFKENLSKQGINQMKNDWKGQGFVSSDWSLNKSVDPVSVAQSVRNGLK